MKSTLKTLKLLADPTRLRIINVLNEESLSVAELQEILGMGQSRISTQLAQLRQEGVVEDAGGGNRPKSPSGYPGQAQKPHPGLF